MKEIKKQIKKILNEKFNFFGNDDEKIFSSLDSINYYKYMLTLESEFAINLENENILTINDSADSVYRIIKK